MREVYLVRHGHCVNSGTLLGQADAGLSPEGIAQAQALGRLFASLPVDRIVTSDLRRAVETAKWIAHFTGSAPQHLNSSLEAVELDPRLREISYGQWDGLTWEQISETDPLAARRKLANWEGWTPPGGEPFSTFVERVRSAWKSICTGSAHVTVLVAHYGVNAILAGDPEFQQDYGTAHKIVLE